MKLRLRSIETNQTLKIEIPNSSSLKNLKQALSLQINSSSDAIHLSLNRKEELLGESPLQTLDSLGVISGDLLFFSVNSSFSPDPTRPGIEKLRDSVNVLVVESDNGENMKDAGVNMNTHEGNCVNLNSDKKFVDSKTLKNVDDENEGNVDLGDTQMGEIGEYMEIDDEGLDLDVGKSLSVPGFLRKVFVEELGNDGGNHHKLLVIAVHAVLLESGFVSYDPVKNLVIKGFNFPEKWPSSAFVMSMRYTLPEIVNHDCASVGVKTVVLKFQSLGNFLKIYGSLSMGSGTHCVCVNEDQLVPFLNFIWANCGSGSETNENSGVLSTDPAREVFAFWRTVKDKLALPLLIDLCEKAGLELPPCFIRLPTDLKLQILARLPGVDVAKVGCTCSELRYLSSSDDLWKQKFLEQYGDAEPSEGGVHWKEKFAKALEKRKRRRLAAGTSLIRRDRHPFPGVIHDRFPGQIHGPFPGRVPGIIGGDYDILPPSIFRPLLLPDQRNPRLRNLLPHCNLGELG